MHLYLRLLKILFANFDIGFLYYVLWLNACLRQLGSDIKLGSSDQVNQLKRLSVIECSRVKWTVLINKEHLIRRQIKENSFKNYESALMQWSRLIKINERKVTKNMKLKRTSHLANSKMRIKNSTHYKDRPTFLLLKVYRLIDILVSEGLKDHDFILDKTQNSKIIELQKQKVIFNWN